MPYSFCNIISRQHSRTTDNVVLKFHEDTFVRHELCKTNFDIHFTCGHENSTRGLIQNINASIQQEAISVLHNINSSGHIHVYICSPTAQRYYRHRLDNEKRNSAV